MRTSRAVLAALVIVAVALTASATSALPSASTPFPLAEEWEVHKAAKYGDVSSVVVPLAGRVAPTVCLLQGLVRLRESAVPVAPSAARHIGTLPPGCRPVKKQNFLVLSSRRTRASVRVHEDGKIMWVSGESGADKPRAVISLNGVVVVVGAAPSREASAVAMNQAEYKGWTRLQAGEKVCVARGWIAPRRVENGYRKHLLTVAPACRPQRNVMLPLPVVGETVTGPVMTTLFSQDGVVQRVAGTREAVDMARLDGVMWIKRGAERVLPLYPGWRNYGRDYAHLSFLKDSPAGLCMLQGVVKPGKGHWVTIIPAECLPGRHLAFHTDVNGQTCRIDITPHGYVYSFCTGKEAIPWISFNGVVYVPERA